MASGKTVIVTGASQGIGAAIVQAFLVRDYKVVAASRSISKAGHPPSPDIALVDGDIGQAETGAKVVKTAIDTFGSIDHLVNNAGIYFSKPFTEYTADDLHGFISTNLEGFLYLTQLAVKQMLAQKTGGSIVTITAALADNPIAGVTAAVPRYGAAVLGTGPGGPGVISGRRSAGNR